MHQTNSVRDLNQLRSDLEYLRGDVINEGEKIFDRWRKDIKLSSFLINAENLAHYLALRRRDLRKLQMDLAYYGLSSLGRSEGRVLANIDSVIGSINGICGLPGPVSYPSKEAFFRGGQILRQNTEKVFGPPKHNRLVRIMVTLPTEAATDYELVLELVKNGMDCARINCAHDDESKWQGMINNLKRAQKETGKSCKVFMDVAGPKIRISGVITPPGQHRIHVNDRVLLTKRQPCKNDDFPFQCSCTTPNILDCLQAGKTVWIDDGQCGLFVEDVIPKGIVLKVKYARQKGFKLVKDKGLNFPDSELTISALTQKDICDLEFISQNADGVGYSFVQTAEDIDNLISKLPSRPASAKPFTLIAKVETLPSVRNLPDMIVRAGGQMTFAIMIARGDLAVEIGYPRLAEIQEELLWMAEAAHIPVIWATQVMEHLTKKGIPSRSEITDAAMAQRAECVMLNKGPYIVDAVSMLDSVLTSMQGHQVKKTPQYRALKMW